MNALIRLNRAIQGQMSIVLSSERVCISYLEELYRTKGASLEATCGVCGKSFVMQHYMGDNSQ